MSRRATLLTCFVGGVAAERLGNGNTFGLGMPHNTHNMSQDVTAENLRGAIMSRVFMRYAGLPVGASELASAGWEKLNSACDPYLGYAWTESRSGPTSSKPLILYTTEDGLPAGVGTMLRNFIPKEQKKWMTSASAGARLVPVVEEPDSNTYQIDVAFRTSDVCKKGAGHQGIGDVLVVNPGGAHRMEIPLKLEAPWKSGSCFDGMGTHAMLNTKNGYAPMPWAGADLFPIVPMYHEGKINAIFFASVTSQLSVPFIATNWWEPMTLNNANMCGNMCDDMCGFTDNGAGDWSTMHIYFNDHSQVECSKDLECERGGNVFMPGRWTCCPAKAASPHHVPEEEPPAGKQEGVPVELVAAVGLGCLLGGMAIGSFAVARGRPARMVQRPSQIDATERELSIS